MKTLHRPHHRLRITRIAKGYANAKVFAEEYKLSYATYIAHESGKIPLPQSAAIKYSKILKIPEEWLLYGDISVKNETMTETTSISIRRKTLEPILIPMIITNILKAIGKYDEKIDYKNLVKKAYVIASEILVKTDDLTEIESYIPAIVTLEKDTLAKSVLKK